MRRLSAYPYLALLLSLTAACQSAPQARQYELEGQILDVRLDAGEVLIKHGDIENFMPGMTMPFKVKDGALLQGREAGDLVKATLTVSGSDAWISSLQKTGSAPITEPARMPAASFVTPLSPGDRVPSTTLTDQRGAPLPLDDWRGVPFAVTFIYVRCPLPQFCPMLDRRFTEVQRGLLDAGLAGRARLLTVSFDPDADTPARLQAHAEKLGADPAIWHFATAPRDVVDRFAAHFGVNVIREADQTITHNMRTAVIGPDGTVVSVYDGSDWTAAQVIEDLRRAAAR